MLNIIIVFYQVIDLTDIERLSLHTLTLLLINLPELQVKFPPNAQHNHQQPHHCLVLSITSKAILDQLDLTQCTWISWTRSWITTTCMRLSGWCTRPGWKTGQIGILIMFGYWVRGRLTNMTFLCSLLLKPSFYFNLSALSTWSCEATMGAVLPNATRSRLRFDSVLV